MNTPHCYEGNKEIGILKNVILLIIKMDNVNLIMKKMILNIVKKQMDNVTNELTIQRININ